jgi:CRISPR type III-B/RAMP module RAMP protein Cmr6
MSRVMRKPMSNLRMWCQPETSNSQPQRRPYELYPQIFNPTMRHENHTHAGLWLDKYVMEDDKDAARASSDESKQTSARTDLIAEVAQIPVPGEYHDFYQRWEETLKAYYAKTQLARAKGRLVVGLGSESVIETSIALHHTYGVPYIPGSALKGLAASYLRYKLNILEESNQKETGAYRELREAYKILFGYASGDKFLFKKTTENTDKDTDKDTTEDIDKDTDSAGYIIFFDALYEPGSVKGNDKDPAEKEPPLHPDIITVHQPDYYQGSNAPNDRQSPIPVPFLSATGVYLLALAAPDIEQQDEKDAWINFTFDLLREALREWGIGAKTSSGYGRMEVEGGEEDQEEVKEEIKEEVVDQETNRIADYIREVQALPNNSSIKGQFQAHLNHWRLVQNHPMGRELAQAIIDKVRQSGCEKDLREKNWYKEVLASLNEQRGGK